MPKLPPAFAALLAATSPVLADSSLPTAPNPTLTPGAVASSDATEVCAPGYDKAHRVWHSRRGTLSRYGIPKSRRTDVTDDDLVPVGLGGDNSNPLNHWAEEFWQAEKKDDLERDLRERVCAGSMSLQAAQRVFISGEWLKMLGQGAGAAQAEEKEPQP